MGIFDRLRRLISSNVNHAIDQAEAPEKMLNQLIREMNEQLIESKKAVAGAIADEKRLERQVAENIASANQWEQRAVMALSASEKEPAKQLEYENLTRQALLRKKEHAEIAEKLAQQHDAQHQAVEKLKMALKDLNLRIEEANRRKTLLIARAKRAEAQKKIQEQVAGMSESSAFDAFEKMAQKVDQLEAEADALHEIEDSTSGMGLEAEFAKLEKQNKGQDLLENFKREQEVKKASIGDSRAQQKSIPQSNIPAQASTEVDQMMEELKRKLRKN